MTPYAQVITAIVLGLGGPLGVLAVWWSVTRRPAAGPAQPGCVPTGFRYCPDEHRTRAATPHQNGSATCDGCGAHIPAPEEMPGA